MIYRLLYFSQTCTNLQNRQIDLFQRAQSIDNQLKNLSQRINEIHRLKNKLQESQLNNERKLRQISELIPTISTEENHERLILTQVDRSKR